MWKKVELTIYNSKGDPVDTVKTMANVVCDDCKLEINPYMMTDRCWEEVAKSDEVLCWGCFRIRIDRRIFPADFMECEANEPFLTYIKEALFQESKDFAEANLPKSSGPMARP